MTRRRGAFGLTEAQKEYLYSAFDVGEKYWLDAWGRAYSKPLGVESLGAADEEALGLTDPVDKEIERVYRQTGNRETIPQPAENTGVATDGEEWILTGDEYTSYAQERGKTAYEALEAAFRSVGYKNASPEEKGEMIAGILDYAYDLAKAERGLGSLDGVEAKAQAAEAAGIGLGDFYLAYNAQKAAKGDKDANGKTINLSASRNKKKAIDRAAVGLTREQKEYLYEAFGVSKQVW